MLHGSFRGAACALRPAGLALMFAAHLAHPQAAAQTMKTRVESTVSASGSASLTIPIQLPPGAAGNEPELALVYSSQGPNSYAGAGWSLRGLSTITRCARTMAQDGVRGSVNLDAGDRLCMDGQRLVLDGNGPYGSGNTQYRTEIDAFSRVTANGPAGAPAESFVVRTKAGLKLEYGTSTDARIEATGTSTIHTWVLKRVTDAKGNTQVYAYAKDSVRGGYYLESIVYGDVSVRFAYTARPDVITNFIGARAIQIDRRLSRITTLVGDSVAREYHLGYGESPHTRTSTLATVTECDGDGVCLSPVSFQMTPEQHAYAQVAGGPWPTYGESFFSGDFNGDGKSDVLSVPIGPAAGWSGWKLHTGTGSGFALAGQGNWPSYGENFHIADFNSDGKSDFLVTPKNGAQGWGWKLYLSTGTDFTLAAQGSWPSAGEAIHIGDYDGDGRPDLLVVATGAEAGWQGWKLLLGTGRGFELAKEGAWPSHGEKFMVADFDADGRSDFLVMPRGHAAWGWKLYLSNGNGFELAGEGGWPNSGEEVQLADFNGDGKADLFIKPRGGQAGWSGWKIFLGTGSGFLPWSEGAWPSHGEQTFLVDVDGDGRADMVAAAKSATEGGWQGWKAYLFDGQGFQLVQEQRWPSFGEQLFFGDFNGDARADFLAVPRSSSAGWAGWKLYASALGGATRSIASVSNFGVATTFTYKPLSDPSVYRKGTASIFPQTDLSVPLYVVSRTEQPDGVGGSAVVDYFYEGLRAELGTGRGLLGFSRVTSRNRATGQHVATTFLHEFPFTGQPSLVEEKVAQPADSEAAITIRTVANTVARGPGSTAASAFVHVATTAERRWDLQGVSLPGTTTTYTYGQSPQWGIPPWS